MELQIKAKAEILFFEDPREKPQVILTGKWTSREVAKTGSLVLKAYRFFIRAVQRQQMRVEETPIDLSTKVLENQTEEELLGPPDEVEVVEVPGPAVVVENPNATEEDLAEEEASNG